MNNTARISACSWLAASAILLFMEPRLVIAAEGPNEWLGRMSIALQKTNYAGTVIRTKSGETEALKVVHQVVDGVVNEKVVVQEGNNLEIIRTGNEVHCILPEKKSVLVETWNDQSSVFPALPSDETRFGNEYDLSVVREDRVAGRKAVLLAIRPHDEFRFGHRIWLDHDTAFPLRTELIDRDGSLIEEVKFADISLESGFSPEALAPSMSLENFTWHEGGANRVNPDVTTDWVCEDLPPGFRVVSTKTEELAGTDEPLTHILYSDGLANVSVFVAATRNRKVARRSSIGGSNAYSILIDGHRITAVGEVPAATVQRIASSMRQN